ncbi:unnamed protein product [Linum trigynum]|uniref:Uncharacterized protein n=1 Tax=Linum trigynum TaxID=586398 RepID=A0AAV2G8I3_9ROSI
MITRHNSALKEAEKTSDDQEERYSRRTSSDRETVLSRKQNHVLRTATWKSRCSEQHHRNINITTCS